MSKDDNAAEATVVFVLGGPGAGKGTMCAKIVDEFNFVHLSAGDLLRAEQKRESDNAKLIRSCIDNGSIVPVDITVALLKNAMKESIAKDNKNRFLVDGFPRNQDNWEGWKRVMGNYADARFTLYLECDEDIMVNRLMGRAAADKAAGQSRSDDNMDTIRKRFTTYIQSTKPIIDMFSSWGKLRTVDASLSPNMVYEQIQKIFKKEF